MPKLKQTEEDRREELIDHLIGNCECDEEAPFDEDDLDTLNKFDTEYLEELVSNHTGEDERDEDEVDDETTNTTRKPKKSKVSKKAKVTNSKTKAKKKKPMPPNPNEEEEEEEVSNADLDEYLESMPSKIRTVLENALASEESSKEKLIEQITSNEKNTFDEDDLWEMSLNQLEGIAALSVNSSNEEEEESNPKNNKEKRIYIYVGNGDKSKRSRGKQTQNSSSPLVPGRMWGGYSEAN